MEESNTVVLMVLAGAIAIAALVALSSFRTIRISPWEHGVLYVGGGFERLLPPGRHRIFGLGRQIHVHRISAGPAYMQIGPIEAVTADRLPIRLSATAVYEITDIVASLSHPVSEAIRLSVSQSLIALGARHTLDELLARTAATEEPVQLEIESAVGPAKIVELVLAGVIMPPELRRAVTEVERARLEGQATLERARGEHAALRSLANAARLLKDNPELMNLRMLQAVGAGKGATLVMGDGAFARTGGPQSAAATTSSGSSS